MAIKIFSYDTHCFFMYTSWGVFSMLQLILIRYSKAFLHGWYMNLHFLIGFLAKVFTIAFGLWAWEANGYRFLNIPHAYFVFPVIFGVPVVVIGGIASRCL